VSFFVTEGALNPVEPDMPCDEAGFLGVFDLNRDLILAAAARAFARGRRGSCDFGSADF
jgi:hypothetical protein